MPLVNVVHLHKEINEKLYLDYNKDDFLIPLIVHTSSIIFLNRRIEWMRGFVQAQPFKNICYKAILNHIKQIILHTKQK